MRVSRITVNVRRQSLIQLASSVTDLELLVAILMFLNLTVSVGTINGLLFYANNEAFSLPIGDELVHLMVEP